MNKLHLLSTALFGLSTLITLPAVAAEGYGKPFEDGGYSKDDWQLVCDNTLTCRAAGYSSEDNLDRPASILITAIPKQSIPKVEVQFASEEDDNGNNEIELWLNDKFYGQLSAGSDGADGGVYQLNQKQAQALLRRARQNTKIDIVAVSNVGSKRWQVSDKGMSAVLLKLDEAQGRVGNALALVSHSHLNKQVPKSAVAKPIIHKAFAYADAKQTTLSPSALNYFNANIEKWVRVDSKPLIGSSDDMGACELANPKSEQSQSFREYATEGLNWSFERVDATHTLASHLCWRGAYNMGYGYWLIDNVKPSSPQLITTSGSEYSEGEIWAIHKARGIGDCWGQKQWVWNGQSFVLATEATTGMCRGFAGGAWQLPTHVAKIIEHNSTQASIAN